MDLETQPGTGVHAGDPVQDPLIGRSIIDQYVVIAKMGEGGMGAVYLAEQTAIGRNAAIKILHPWLSHNAAIASRFQTEARAAARLQNPHIVSIYNYGRMPDGTLFLAMEHLTGCTLAELIAAEGKLEPARAVAIATQCCEALAEAHRRGVVHRDLKPSNIMLVSRGGGPDFVKVLDFGIAKIDGNDGTRPRAVLGTPQYMAPEQLESGTVDQRSDIYALGLVVYEMLTGRPPFSESSVDAYRRRHVNDAPPSFMQASPDLALPPALEACVMRALAKAPHQRPQSADVFAEELWAALMATVEHANLPMPIVRPPRPSGRVVASAIAVALLAVIGLGTGSYLLLRDTDAPSEASDASVEAAEPPDRPEDATDYDDPAMSEDKRALMSKSVTELEAELQRVTILSGMPRSSVELSLHAYREAVASPPSGADPRRYRKALLAELIIAWRAHRHENQPPDRSLDELEAVFLTMQSPLDLGVRRSMLNRLKSAAADDPDADATIRLQLVRWIDAYGEDVDEDVQIVED